MIKTRTEINKEVQYQFSKKTLIVSIILMIVGAIGLLTYVVLSAIFDYKGLSFLILFSVPFGLGVSFLLTVKKIIKSTEKNPFVNEYEFEDTFVNVSSIKNNEVIATQKLYYKDIVKIKENDKYIHIFITPTTAFVVDKVNTNSDDINEIKKLLKM